MDRAEIKSIDVYLSNLEEGLCWGTYSDKALEVELEQIQSIITTLDNEKLTLKDQKKLERPPTKAEKLAAKEPKELYDELIANWGGDAIRRAQEFLFDENKTYQKIKSKIGELNSAGKGWTDKGRTEQAKALERKLLKMVGEYQKLSITQLKTRAYRCEKNIDEILNRTFSLHLVDDAKYRPFLRKVANDVDLLLRDEQNRIIFEKHSNEYHKELTEYIQACKQEGLSCKTLPIHPELKLLPVEEGRKNYPTGIPPKRGEGAKVRHKYYLLLTIIHGWLVPSCEPIEKDISQNRLSKQVHIIDVNLEEEGQGIIERALEYVKANLKSEQKTKIDKTASAATDGWKPPKGYIGSQTIIHSTIGQLKRQLNLPTQRDETYKMPRSTLEYRRKRDEATGGELDGEIKKNPKTHEVFYPERWFKKQIEEYKPR